MIVRKFDRSNTVTTQLPRYGAGGCKFEQNHMVSNARSDHRGNTSFNTFQHSSKSANESTCRRVSCKMRRYHKAWEQQLPSRRRQGQTESPGRPRSSLFRGVAAISGNLFYCTKVSDGMIGAHSTRWTMHAPKSCHGYDRRNYATPA